MTKSSEVLRLAAEKYFSHDNNCSISFLCGDDDNLFERVYKFAVFCGYRNFCSDIETSWLLCLAAAIAESQGD